MSITTDFCFEVVEIVVFREAFMRESVPQCSSSLEMAVQEKRSAYISNVEEMRGIGLRFLAVKV